MLKRLFCASTSILMLALVSHVGAQSAQAQGGTIAAAETTKSVGTREAFIQLERFLRLATPMRVGQLQEVLSRWGFAGGGGYWELSDTAGRVLVMYSSLELLVTFKPANEVQVNPAIIAGLIQKSATITLNGMYELDVVVGQEESDVPTGLGEVLLDRGMIFDLSGGLWTGTYFELKTRKGTYFELAPRK